MLIFIALSGSFIQIYHSLTQSELKPANHTQEEARRACMFTKECLQSDFNVDKRKYVHCCIDSNDFGQHRVYVSTDLILLMKLAR